MGQTRQLIGPPDDKVAWAPSEYCARSFHRTSNTFIMPTEPPPSRIREYTPRDEKQVRFIIGQAQMEALAYANKSSEDDNTNFPLFRLIKLYIYFSAYFHPLTLAIWICLSSMFAQYMDWWPNSTYGILSWLRVLPAFFVPAVPIMSLVDWYAPQQSPPPLYCSTKIPFCFFLFTTGKTDRS